MTAEQISQQIIRLLKEHDQYALLPEVVHLLQEEAYRNQDISVICAVPLQAKEEKELRESLLKKWGEHRVVISVDPILLTGLMIKFQDKVIDLSGRAALHNLKQELS